MLTKSSILMFALASSTLSASALVATGCAGAEQDQQEGFVLLSPELGSIAPTALTLGETVTVVGKNFIDAKDGSLSLLLDGNFVDSDGVSHEFIGEILLDVKNPSVAEFSFEEIFFHPSRDKVGTWTGLAVLVNRRPNTDDIGGESERWSEEVRTSLRVEPSVMITKLRSADNSGCPEVSSATNSDQNIELGFKAIGLGVASEEHPWTVKMSFVSPEMLVRYVVPDAFDFWPINGPLNDSVSTLVGEGSHRVEFDIVSGSEVILDPTKTARTVRISPAVTIGQNSYSEVILGTLLAGATPEGGKNTVNFVVEISADDGRSLRRLVSFDVWSELELGIWSGAERIVERYEAHAVSGCIPGGDIGRNLTYSESESITESRDINVKWNAETSSSLGFSAGISSTSVSSNLGWSQSFGVDVSEGVSSSVSMGQNISVQLLPGYFGMSYRQLERLERVVNVIYHNSCGQSGVVGEAELVNWNFAFDIAQGGQCPPATNLPPAELF